MARRIVIASVFALLFLSVNGFADTLHADFGFDATVFLLNPIYGSSLNGFENVPITGSFGYDADGTHGHLSAQIGGYSFDQYAVVGVSVTPWVSYMWLISQLPDISARAALFIHMPPADFGCGPYVSLYCAGTLPMSIGEPHSSGSYPWALFEIRSISDFDSGDELWRLPDTIPGHTFGDHYLNSDVSSISSMPEPSSWILLGSGLLLAVVRLRHRL